MRSSSFGYWPYSIRQYRAQSERISVSQDLSFLFDLRPENKGPQSRHTANSYANGIQFCSPWSVSYKGRNRDRHAPRLSPSCHPLTQPAPLPFSVISRILLTIIPALSDSFPRHSKNSTFKHGPSNYWFRGGCGALPLALCPLPSGCPWGPRKFIAPILETMLLPTASTAPLGEVRVGPSGAVS